ncbi:pseudaminic acid CMP-transferase [Bacteriovorax sp. BAL6_X]|uniref:pseudaminic acid cytidylyltransferase n=1 Tax=Bacteriovorax sp. BAL6_X TaxID=1201290 RepID=UPI000385816F|nr:pseudaminic acid cytidylyltransferase [Bacteriovorax sp. BAL6_X]EPZ50361.1 pseudaminic acid CMP-transferase [Bacteriovorax sp. BAL6_X]
MSAIAIITARGGSKRIPGKNIKDFCGKPIIAYSIEAALNSGIFSRVIVSTDDEEIKRVSEEYGAEVPFMRSDKNSDDFATTADVLKEVILNLKELGESYDHYCCFYPTAPFVTGDHLLKAFKEFTKDKFDSLIPVTKFSFPPQRAFFLKEKKILIDDNESFQKRSQDLTPLYHDCGQYYFFKENVILDNMGLVSKNTTYVLRDNLFVQDIDELSDWDLAEIKFKYLREKELV